MEIFQLTTYMIPKMIICKTQIQIIHKNFSPMNYGGKLTCFFTFSFRHHFSSASRNLIRLPPYETTHLPESQGTKNRESIKKEIIIEHMKICSNLTQLECIYAYMIKNSYNQDCFMINQFVSACSSFSRIDYAIQAFTQMDEPNVFVYNAVIRACVCCFSPIQALWFYIKMLSAKIYPTSYTFSSVIKGCALVAQCRIGEAVNGQIWKFGFNSHLYVQTALIDFYSCLGKIFESRLVFDEMVERDVFAWTSMISVHAKSGDLVSARKLFDEMPERNFASWNSLIDGYARIKDVESAEFLFSKMPVKDLISWTTMINCYSQNKLYTEGLATYNNMTTKNGIIPDEVTMATVISACAHLGALDLGKQIHLQITKSHINLDVYIGSALIDMYAKCGNLDQSLLVFYKLPEKNLFCWNSIIDGLALHGYANEALKMFNHMKNENIRPNGVTFISVLSACTHGGLVEEGRRCFLSMARDFHISPEIEHYGCMVDLLCKAGLLEDALKVINEMKMEPNSVIWGALLGGCKLVKNLEMAQIAVRKLMILEPDNSGYYTLLVNMFAEENRWSEVARIRGIMKEFGVEKKKPGSSWIEIEGKIHQFSASDKYHESCDEIYLVLDRLCGSLVVPVCGVEYVFGS